MVKDSCRRKKNYRMLLKEVWTERFCPVTIEIMPPTFPNPFPTSIHKRNPKDSGNVPSGEPGCTDSFTTKSLMFHHLTPPFACWCPSESRPTAMRKQLGLKKTKQKTDSLPSRSCNSATHNTNVCTAIRHGFPAACRQPPLSTAAFCSGICSAV